MNRIKRWLGAERGAGYVEAVLTLPLFLMLMFLIISFAWYWWSQATVATAVHDGGRAAAQRAGNAAAGRAKAAQVLGAGLGNQARTYLNRYQQTTLEPWRSVRTEIKRDSRPLLLGFIDIPYFTVQAGSLQRLEQFYGGPPDEWE